MNVEIKPFYTAKELADMALNSLPTAHANVRKKAIKENWASQKRAGRGGGVEYPFEALPAEVQAEIKRKSYQSLVPQSSTSAARQVAVIANRDLRDLDDAQRAISDARMQMTLLVGQYQASLGSRNKALDAVVAMSRDGALPVDDVCDYNQVCARALARTSKTVGVGKRVLNEWCIAADKCSTPTERLAALAPRRQGQPVIEPTNIEWLPDFMGFYCTPNRPTVAEAHYQFAQAYASVHGEDAVPHYDAVRRALAKLPIWVRETKRLTGSAMRGLRAYVTRDWNADFMRANDIWVGDGHSLKCRVAHPMHGQAFTPELTLIIDAVSRYIVGWSLSYSESQIAVGDALRHAIERHGVPAIYYSDNGSGQKNKTFDTDVTGVFARLGVHHATGIPGNPQGRGIIERQMKEVPKRIAKAFDTYYGKDADPETVRNRLGALQSYNNALTLGKDDAALSTKQKYARKILPSWAELITEVIEQVAEYNNQRIHSALKTTPTLHREKMLAAMEDELVLLSADEARDLFRPSFNRVVDRGQVRWDSELYAHEELEFWSDKEVVVYVDQHDPSSVIVRDLDGRFICEALLDGNTRDGFSKNVIEKAQEKRAKAQIKRKESDIARIKAQNRKTIEHQKTQVLSELFSGKTVETIAKQEYAMFECDLDMKTVNDK